MTAQYKRALQVPQGTEAFYLEEAYRHRRLSAAIEERFLLWGYLPVQTPSFDFYDVYTPLLREEDARSIYRLIDREGDLLMLRSDITLFLAKQMGLILRPEDLPTRVFYADSILRHQAAEDISKNEFFQIGAELVGKPGMEADAEIILMLLDVLERIGVREFFIHLGCRSLFDAGFAGSDDDARRQARRGVQLRDRQAVRTALEARDRDAAEIDALLELYSFIGDLGELEELLSRLSGDLNEAELAAIEETLQLYRLLGELDAASRLRLDFSEIGNQPYHTGVAFQVYMDGLDSAVAAGGRYDGLLSVFGLDAPSVGFSLMLRKMQDQLATDSELFTPPRAETAPGEDFAARVRAARAMRDEGRTTLL
ncbi:MAG: ATP phosphoribosyltransferase regulatory subunit [Spirochaetaceae bacterium]